jgi:hypothetical protein
MNGTVFAYWCQLAMSSLLFSPRRILCEGHKRNLFQPHFCVLFFDVAFKFLDTNDVSTRNCINYSIPFPFFPKRYYVTYGMTFCNLPPLS